MNRTYPMRSSISLAEENARFMTRVYGWMSGGILVTAIISRWVAGTPAIMELLFGNRLFFWVMIILQLGAVFTLSAGMQKLSATAATLIYFAYAALTGVTFSVIFLAYTSESIVNVFAVTSCAFAGLSAFGYFTKRDLGPVGSFCTMGLFGLVGFSLLSFFFPSLMTESTNFAYSIIGLVVFSGLTAYDTQRIKSLNILGNEGTAEDHKEAIHGALTLYLDFIQYVFNAAPTHGRPPGLMKNVDLHGKVVTEAEEIFYDLLNQSRLEKKLIEINFITGIGILQRRIQALATENDLHAYSPLHNRGCIIVEFE